jgi:hypothetical protein
MTWLAVVTGLTVAAAGCTDYDVTDEDDTYPPLGDDDDTGPGDDDDTGVSDDDTGIGDDDTGDDDTGPGDDDTGDDDTGPGDDDTGPGDDDDDDDDTGPGDDDGDDDDETDEDCPNGVAATVTDSDGDGWVVILSDDPTDWAIVNVPVDGVYELYDSQLAESGASQMNETGYLTISNSVNPVGFPVNPNCGGLFIVADADNNGTPTQPTFLGTFSLMAGEDNLLTLNHYCGLYQAGQCQQFHNGDPNSGSGCNTNNANSIHMDIDGLCITSW